MTPQPLSRSLSQKIREQKNIFLREMFHDIRTPLASVKEASSLLWEELLGPLNEPQKKCADIARQEILKIQKWLDPILELSFLDTDPLAFSFEWIPLNRILEEADSFLQRVCSQKNRILEKEFHAFPASLRLDSQIFQKAFQLLSLLILEQSPPQSTFRFVFQKMGPGACFELRSRFAEPNTSPLTLLLSQNASLQKECLKKAPSLFSKGFVALSLLELLGLRFEIGDGKDFSAKILIPSASLKE